MNCFTMIKKRFQESIEVKTNILQDDSLIHLINDLAGAITESIQNGGKLLLCGNGGSASDALHTAGELVGRFQQERKAWPAIVLNADVATLTAIANDYGYDEIFARQVEAHMTHRDLLLGISTSGNSNNIVRAFVKAKEIGGKTALLSGRDGGKLKSMADFPVVVSSNVTARIQESHICIAHILCELVESELAAVTAR